MAVLVEAISVIVRCDAILARLPGGQDQFGEVAERLVLLRIEGKMAVYLDTRTGKEVWGSRTVKPGE